MTLYILFKYWKKHIKSAIALVFSGVLLTTIVFITLMLNREKLAEQISTIFFDQNGRYEVIVANSDDEILETITKDKSGYNYGAIQVYGEFDGLDYGTIEDEHNICHIPLSEGRMPEEANEIAADRGALDKLFWTGKCGDTIELNGKTYTVVGIIDEKYGAYRAGSEFNNFDLIDIKNSPYKIPLIFVGKCDGKPLYRIDMLSNYLKLNLSDEDFNKEVSELNTLLFETVGYENGWFSINLDERNCFISLYSLIPTKFFISISWLGVAISALSVFSVLRTIFTERRTRIEMLRRIGMKKRDIAFMYAAECLIFIGLQIFFGIIFGVLAYQGAFLFRTNVMGEKLYSGFTDIYGVIIRSPDPFVYSIIFPSVIVIAAYLLCILTDKIKHKSPDKNAEPRPFSKCFEQIFCQKAVSATQIVALTLICFSVLVGYMYYTDNGKTGAEQALYISPDSSFKANGLNMKENNIAEYYSSDKPTVNYIGETEPRFPFIVDNFSAGIDYNTANSLPEYTLSFGSLPQTLMSSEKRNFRYINEIDTTNESFRQGLLSLSSEEYQNFFEEGQLGSMYLYSVETKLTTSKVIESISGNVTKGELNIEKLNSGEEIIVAYTGIRPPFETGETISINSISATESGYGIGEISSAEVKIGALVKIPPDYDRKINSIVRNREDYYLLTTATGAENMGLPCAKYTGIYTSEPMDGGLIPSAAQMKMQSLEIMQHDYLVDRMIKNASSIAILLVMSLLGFSAYFNGIGMKIRLKKYEISVLRAVGMNIKNLRKELLLNSIKIPLISSVAAYVLAKIVQLENWAGLVLIQIMNNNHQNQSDLFIPVLKFAESNLYIDSLMWQANAEIPALILFAVLCAVTFLLTIIALRKFKSNIAGDLSEGMTRQ